MFYDYHMVYTMIKIFPSQLFILSFFLSFSTGWCSVNFLLPVLSSFLCHEVPMLSFHPQSYVWHPLFNNAQINTYQTSALRVTVQSLTCAYDAANPMSHLIYNLHASLQPGRAGSEELFSHTFKCSCVCLHVYVCMHTHKEETAVLY